MVKKIKEGEYSGKQGRIHGQWVVACGLAGAVTLVGKGIIRVNGGWMWLGRGRDALKSFFRLISQNPKFTHQPTGTPSYRIAWQATKKWNILQKLKSHALKSVQNDFFFKCNITCCHKSRTDNDNQILEKSLVKSMSLYLFAPSLSNSLRLSYLTPIARTWLKEHTV